MRPEVRPCRQAGAWPAIRRHVARGGRGRRTGHERGLSALRHRRCGRGRRTGVSSTRPPSPSRRRRPAGCSPTGASCGPATAAATGRSSSSRTRRTDGSWPTAGTSCGPPTAVGRGPRWPADLADRRPDDRHSSGRRPVRLGQPRRSSHTGRRAAGLQRRLPGSTSGMASAFPAGRPAIGEASRPSGGRLPNPRPRPFRYEIPRSDRGTTQPSTTKP